MKSFTIKIAIIFFALLSINKVNAQTVTITQLHQACNNDGILVATVTGLTPPIRYYWPGKVDTTMNLTDTLFTYNGDYIYCQADDGVNIAYSNNFFSPPFTYSVSTTNPMCPVTMGTGSVTITGGASPYTVNWYDVNTGAYVTTGQNASLPVGEYSLSVTDANGCTFVKYDSIWIMQQSPVNVSVTTTTANCTNGTASVSTVTGGVGPYTYLWSNGQVTSTISNLTTGYYNVNVTDAQGCGGFNTAYVPQAITINPNVVTTSATCLQNNGSVITFGSGGTPPYSYVYSNGQTTQTASGLVSSWYDVQVTDANGCISPDYGFFVGSSTPINVTYSTTTSSCTTPNGSAGLSITGGQAPYTINWGIYPMQTGPVLSNVFSGTYSFYITDVNGCVQHGSVYVPAISYMSGWTGFTNATCPLNNNGTALMNGYSSNPPLTYLWNTGATTQSINNLSAGYYDCTITDAVGCKLTKQAFVGIASPVYVSASTVPATCIFTSNGSATAHPTGGAAPYTYYWSNGQTTQTATGLLTGHYWVHVTDANGCSASDWVFVDYNHSNNSCYCTVSGTVYHDTNANCIKDPGEAPVEHMLIKNNNTVTSYSVSAYAFSDTAGKYSFILPSGTYNIQEVIQAMYPPSACQSNSNPLTFVATPGCNYVVNFANAINPIHDVHVINTHLTMPVPGNNYVQQIIVQNDGTVPESNIQFSYEHDGQLTYSNSSGINLSQPNPTTAPNWYNNTGITPTLNPGQGVSTLITLGVPTNIPLGTVVNFWDSMAYTSPMSNWLNDYTPWNNVRAFDTVIVGSFDPNVKEVSPRGVGPMGFVHSTDTVFDYVIHFQNTGSYNASKVVVVDSLDPDFNWESLKPGYSNHNYTASMTNTGVVSFTFNNINLPPANSNPLGSIGVITYSIRAKKNLPQGTQFKNNAAIYFDYNAPVITNTTINTINDAVGVHEVVKSNDGLMSLYPNPANESFTLVINSSEDAKANVEIYSIEGQLVQKEEAVLHNGENKLGVSVSVLNTGIYFVRVTAGAKQHSAKLSVVK